MFLDTKNNEISLAVFYLGNVYHGWRDYVRSPVKTEDAPVAISPGKEFPTSHTKRRMGGCVNIRPVGVNPYAVGGKALQEVSCSKPATVVAPPSPEFAVSDGKGVTTTRGYIAPTCESTYPDGGSIETPPLSV